MPAACVKPDANAVAEYLSMVYGNDIEVSDADGPPDAAAHGGRFVNDSDQLVAVCVCDIAFAAYSACALSMIPAGGANDMVDEGELSATAADNFHEVMNLCSRLIMSNSSAHLRLDGAPSGDELTSLTEQLPDAQTVAFSVEFPKYGTGKMAFWLT